MICSNRDFATERPIETDPASALVALLFATFALPLIVSLFFKASWLWMDEVLSCLLIDDSSLRHMNAAIVSGMDANPPLFPNLYWLLGHGISTNIYFLRSVSVVLFAGTVAAFYRFVCRLLPAPSRNFGLILAIGSLTYLNFTLATQIRGYALFFAIGCAYFIAVHRLLLAPRQPAALAAHLLTGTLLVFSHNFGLFYLAATGALFALRWLAGRGRYPAHPFATHALIAGLWFVGWFPSFVIQARSGQPHSWIALPTWHSFFATVGELAPSVSSRLERIPGLLFLPILRFAALAAAFAYFTRQRLRLGLVRALADDAFRFYFIAGFIYFATLAIGLVVSFVHISVFLSRYFWPSELLVMYQVIYVVHQVLGRRAFTDKTLPRSATFDRAGPRWAAGVCAAVCAAFIFFQNRKLVVFPRAIVSYLTQLKPAYPVFVETADYFLPLWFHHSGIPVRYVLDWPSASRPDNALSATVENRILTGVREHYGLPGIVPLRDFNAQHFPHFYLVDETSVLEFERFLDSGAIEVLGQVPVAVAGHRILECRFAAQPGE